jgi:hypothetical protein
MNRTVEDDVQGRAADGEPQGALAKRVDDTGRPATSSAWLNANLSFRVKGRDGGAIKLDLSVGVTIIGILALLAWLIP